MPPARSGDYSLAPPLVAIEDRNQLEQWFATWRGGIGSKHKDLEIVMGDEIAYAHGNGSNKAALDLKP